MFSFFDISKDLQHAYLLEGEKEKIFNLLLDFLNKKLGFSTVANPDFWVGDFDSLGINDSRAIKDFQMNKALIGERKILVIKTNFITQEAQNSLLKVFEEPTRGTYLFLLMPSSENILPTLRSRLMVIKNLGVSPPSKLGGDTPKFSPKFFAEDFLKASLPERLKLIKVFLPKKKEDKVDKARVIDFLNELEQFLYQDFEKQKTTIWSLSLSSEKEIIFSEIRQCRSYLNDRSPSVKMILEHLSQII